MNTINKKLQDEQQDTSVYHHHTHDDNHHGDCGCDAPSTIVYSEPKIGRNDPCYCGSGKKYKKCCL
jgi:uncharacterized protein YecA (UPF0149 family)